MSVLRELHAAPYAWALLVLVLFTAAALWLLVNRSMELAIVLQVRPSHGLTLGDLAVVPVIAVALLARRFLSRAPA